MPEITTYVIDKSDRSVQEILERLCFLAQIQEGDKIDITHLSLQEPGLWTSFIRTLSGGEQSRQRTLEFIKKLTDEALEVTEKCFSGTNTFHHKMGTALLNKLIESENGIRKLSITYNDDKFFASKIETILLILDAKIEELKRNYLKI